MGNNLQEEGGETTAMPSKNDNKFNAAVNIEED